MRFESFQGEKQRYSGTTSRFFNAEMVKIPKPSLNIYSFIIP